MTFRTKFLLFVSICVPPNNPITACGVTSFPGYHSFPKWAIDFVGHRMRSFFSIFLFGKYLLFNFSSFIGTFCITECVRFCLVAVPILASDYLEFGPDDPQTRFEFGAVVVRFCASFNSSVGANRIIVTEIYFFLRKLFSLRAHWLASQWSDTVYICSLFHYCPTMKYG